MSEGRGAVLVTGSSTGIGRACALRLDRGGFQVFAGVRKRADAESLEAEGSERLEPVILDVTDETTISNTAERILEVTNGQLAGLVNNAGIGVGGPIEALDIDDLRRQLEVNLTSQVAVTQAFLPQIRAARGRIVFMASIAGRMSVPFLAPYSASKHGLEAIADALRGEMKPFGVEVSIVEPGSIATPIWDKAQDSIGDLQTNVSPEHRELYGKQMESFAKSSQETAERGIPPDKVAEAVEHALTASKPKTRYLVGRDARQQAFVRKWLPDRIVDRLVAREMGL
jgi:NAD(P)-dependent dehydrogenase (short-subunit alcohol dehydrogenase family)